MGVIMHNAFYLKSQHGPRKQIEPSTLIVLVNRMSIEIEDDCFLLKCFGVAYSLLTLTHVLE